MALSRTVVDADQFHHDLSESGLNNPGEVVPVDDDGKPKRTGIISSISISFEFVSITFFLLYFLGSMSTDFQRGRLAS
jgi:hypothetical protein